MAVAGSAPVGLPLEESTKSFWHTQPSSLLMGHRSTRNLPLTADVVIIGSGITGASIAHHLLHDDSLKGNVGDSRSDHGPAVVMLEAREACWGATGRNGGHCQPVLFDHPHDQSIPRFELQNFHALSSLIQSKQIDCEFVAQPGVRGMYSADHVADKENALALLESTAPDLYKMIRMVKEPSELAKLRLRCSTGSKNDAGAIAALVTDTAARMWPYKFVARILEDLLLSTVLPSNGSLNLQTLTPVRNIIHTIDGQWSVTTERGNILARKLVLATNAYTSHLLPSFSDLIVPCRGQMSALVPPPFLRDQNRLPNSYGLLGEGIDDYLIQRPNESGGHLMFGGGRQMGPSMGTIDDSVIDPDTASYLRRKLPKVFTHPSTRQSTTPLPDEQTEETELHATHEWTGIMGFSRDDLPWVGPVPGFLLPKPHSVEERPSNLYIAAGYTGHGMPNAWLCGKAVALMASRDEANVEAIRNEVGVPRAYIVTEARVKRARTMASVASRDWAEMQRGSDANAAS